MLFLVDLPNPVHGMSTVNRCVIQYFRAQEMAFSTINTVPSYAASQFGKSSWFVIKLAHTCFCMLRLTLHLLLKRKQVVYRSINGGSGLWYDIIYLGICRLFGARVFIHHHSFNYINTSNRPFSIVNRICGNQTIHIVLGEAMATGLIQRYAILPAQIRIQSNVAFFDVQGSTTTQETPRNLAIGHLANLSFEKGLGTFIDVCYRLHADAVPFSAYLAGPTSDPAVKAAIDKATRDLPNVKYIGPVYANAKDEFYRNLDAFIFPTRYANEAEPLVLYEAATHGSLLIGTGRGCMAQVIPTLGGHAIPENQDLPEVIANLLVQSIENRDFDSAHRSARTARLAGFQQQARQSLHLLFSEMKPKHVSEA